MTAAHDLRKSLALRSRLPPEKSFISLSHAVSWIALRRSTAGPVLSRLLGVGRPQQDRVVQNERLDTAIKSSVEMLADLATGGKIEIYGQYYVSILDDDGDGRKPTQRISAQALIDFRGFDTLDDTLFPGRYRDVELAWSSNRKDNSSPLERHYRFVLVNRTDLMREFPDEVADGAKPRPFTDTERKNWIRNQPQQSVDAAHKKYQVHPRYDGTKQEDFRPEWKTERGTSRGRPPKKS